MAGEKQVFDVEPVGDHEYLVRVQGTDEVAEAWLRVSPEVLEGLAVELDESTVVHRTVAFLLRHQDATEFPSIIELEDVLASYPDYRSALTGEPDRIA